MANGKLVQSNYSLISCIKLELSPCLVEIVDETKTKFIVGTYELIESGECSENINSRRGSLLLFENNELIFEHECEDGGVFDLKFIGDAHGARIYVAHSNGILALYNLIENKIILDSRVNTNSTLLTCIYHTVSNESHVVVVGDSHGFLTIHKDMQQQCKTQVVDQELPIWSVYAIPLSNTQLFLFVGSDDSLLRFIDFSCHTSQKKLILKNRDAISGVTSINATYERTGPEYNGVLYVGSYDEHVRIYDFRFHFNDDVSSVERLECSCRSSIKIEGGGIWDIKLLESCGEVSLLIAAMYSGLHILKNNVIISSINTFESGDVHTDKHLIYGVAANKNLTRVIASSFYKKEVYLFQKRCSTEIA